MPEAPLQAVPPPLAAASAGSPAGHGRAPRGLDTVALGQKQFARFGRMFPELRALNVPDEKLRLLAAKMVDTVAGAAGDNANVPSGYTYLGQFIDHDITLDVTPLGAVRKDPHALEDFRTPRLDLDQVYGDGPVGSPYLYDRTDPRKLLLGTCGPGLGGDASVKAGLRHDLPRSPEGLALIGDPRNDENLLVAQTNVAFLRFHNAVVDILDPNGTGDAGTVFETARQTVTWHYQWIVLHDFLDRLIDMNELHDVLARGRKLFHFEDTAKFGVPFMPVEFSVAAYRLGHSMVRETYNHNRVFHAADFNLLFSFTGLSGGIVGSLFDAADPAANAALAAKLKLLVPGIVVPSLPGDWIIDWHRFYELGDDEPAPAGNRAKDPGDNFARNMSRRIDPYLAPVLQDLPGGGDSLPFRNLARGVRMGLPSGQDVARLMNARGVPVETLSAAQLGANGPEGQTDGDTLRQLGLVEQTPLWFYVLKEALVLGDGGARLGPVGSRILAEVFVGMLQADGESFLSMQPTWRPFLPAAQPGTFTMPDLLRIAGGLNPVNDPANIVPPPAPPAH